MRLPFLSILTLLMLCSLVAQSEGDFCTAKFKKGKIVSESDCENQGGVAVPRKLDSKVKARGHCDFTVGDVCYWSYLNSNYDKAITFKEARKICAEKGSIPAYFPTELDYNRTVESLRAKIIAMGTKEANAYTGVVLNGKTLKVTRPDTEVYMKWFPVFPRSCKACTSVFIHVDSNPKSTNQGMINYNPTVKRYGVVCQSNLN